MSDLKQMLGELRRHDSSHSINCTFTPCDCGRHDELTSKIATALDTRSLRRQEVRSCSMGGCDERATVGVRWTGDADDCFQFCDEHDPRKAGES